MRPFNPPPRVNPSVLNGQSSFARDNAANNSRDMKPNLSNWRKEGYPSEFSYAQAHGLLDIPKATPRQDVNPRDIPTPPHYDRAPVSDDPRSKNRVYFDDDFEQAVQREIALLEASFNKKLVGDDVSHVNSNQQPQGRYSVERSDEYHHAMIDKAPTEASTNQPSMERHVNQALISRNHVEAAPAARRIGGGIKSLYGQDHKDIAIKQAYAKLLQQQIDEQKVSKGPSNSKYPGNYPPQDNQSVVSHNNRFVNVGMSNAPYNQIPETDRWKPSGNYIDDRERAKRAEMKIILDRQREEDARRRQEMKEREKQEELRLEAKVREAAEREENEKKKELEMKKRAAEEKERRQIELYEEIQRQGKKQPKMSDNPSRNHEHHDRHDAGHPMQNMSPGYERELPNHDVHHDEYPSHSPMKTDRSDMNNSPNKPARAKLISDVYGSAGIFGNNVSRATDQIDNRWRPSGNILDDKTKAARLEMRAMLDRQREDDIRRKEEEKRRIQEEDMRLEMKFREAQEQEELRKKKEEEMKRQQAMMQERAAQALEEKRLEAKTLKTRRRMSHISEAESPVKAIEHPKDGMIEDFKNRKPIAQGSTDYSQGKDSKPSIQDPRYPSRKPDESYSSDRDYPNEYDMNQYRDPRSYHRNPDDYRNDYSRYGHFNPDKYQNMSNIPPDYRKYPPQYNDIRNSYDKLNESSIDQRFPVNPNRYRDMNGKYDHNMSHQKYRPDSADQRDAFLASWQAKQNGMNRSEMQQDFNDVSFVGESRFINSSMDSSVRSIFRDDRNDSIDGLRNYKKIPRSYGNFDRDIPLDGEKSLDSESFFYYLGERPSILDESPKDKKPHHQRGEMDGISNAIRNPIRRDDTNNDTIKSYEKKTEKLSKAVAFQEDDKKSPLMDLIKNTNNFIQEERRKNSFNGISNSILSPRSAVTAAEVINPQKPSTGLSSPPSTAGTNERSIERTRRKQVNINYENHIHDDNHRNTQSLDEWIGEDEIVVMPYRKSSVNSLKSPLNSQSSPAKKFDVEKMLLESEKNKVTDLQTLLETPKQLIRADSDSFLLNSTSRNGAAKGGLLSDDMTTSIRPVSARRFNHASDILSDSTENTPSSASNAIFESISGKSSKTPKSRGTVFSSSAEGSSAMSTSSSPRSSRSSSVSSYSNEFEEPDVASSTLLTKAAVGSASKTSVEKYLALEDNDSNSRSKTKRSVENIWRP